MIIINVDFQGRNIDKYPGSDPKVNRIRLGERIQKHLLIHKHRFLDIDHAILLM